MVINLLNRFIIVGNLSEARVDLYPSHLKAKLAVNINNFTVNCNGIFSRRFKQEQYLGFLNLLQYLYPEVDGEVYVNHQSCYTLTANNPTKLLISGSTFPTDEQVFFNFKYCKICQPQAQDSIDIALKGQFISNKQFLNITFDSPKVFNIDKPDSCTLNTIYQLNCTYRPNYDIVNDVVYSFDDINNIQIIDWIDTGYNISQYDIKQYLREWDMINQ